MMTDELKLCKYPKKHRKCDYGRDGAFTMDCLCEGVCPNEPKFTPGPWFVGLDSKQKRFEHDIWGSVRAEALNGFPVAKVSLLDSKEQQDICRRGLAESHTPPITLANARLIAKSPEMFDVLLELLEIDAESNKIVQTGTNPDDVTKIGKDILRVIDKSRKIVDSIKGVK